MKRAGAGTGRATGVTTGGAHRDGAGWSHCRISGLPKPVIGVINGPAVGVGPR